MKDNVKLDYTRTINELVQFAMDDNDFNGLDILTIPPLRAMVHQIIHGEIINPDTKSKVTLAEFKKIFNDRIDACEKDCLENLGNTH